MVAATLTVAGCRRNETPEVVAPVPTSTEIPTAQTDSPTAPTATPAPTQPTTTTAGAEGTTLNPPKSGRLTAQQAGAQVNLRSQPNAQSSSKGYGLVGDSVQLLRAAEGNDNLTWYYVKFQESGAEGWIRGDFIDTSDGPVAAASQSVAATTLECEGLFEETVFIARYSGSGFTRIDFRNLETNTSFGGNLSYQGENSQGQPTFTGSVTAPAGGSYQARITDLSGGNPRSGSQVALDYEGIPASGICK
ncbi:SH3 domain-containing protein [Pseudanabaena sp. FACHB-2040]|nr:SH3 domain-containing protein [Pseudanabaena sp. FACHB-2040]